MRCAIGWMPIWRPGASGISAPVINDDSLYRETGSHSLHSVRVDAAPSALMRRALSVLPAKRASSGHSCSVGNTTSGSEEATKVQEDVKEISEKD
jgi:hypothetical protein